MTVRSRSSDNWSKTLPAHHDCGEWLSSDGDRQAGFLAQQHIEVAQEGAAARQNDPPSNDIGS